MYSKKTNLAYLGRSTREILIRPRNGGMPKYGHTYNFLKLCSIEPVTKEQLSRLFSNPYKILNSARKYGFITEEDGKFVLTSEGVAELNVLEVRLGVTEYGKKHSTEKGFESFKRRT